MKQELKTLLNIVHPFIEKYCGDISVDFDESLRASSGVWCSKEGKNISLPIDIERALENFLDNIEIDLHEDCGEQGECYSFEVVIDSERRSIEIHGLFTSYGEEEGPSRTMDYSDEEEIINYINKVIEENNLKGELSITFDGSGDSGYIESFGEDEEGNSFDVEGPIEDICYNLLSDYGGWEINEGSFGRIVINPQENEATCLFTWRTEDSDKVLQYESKY